MLTNKDVGPKKGVKTPLKNMFMSAARGVPGRGPVLRHFYYLDSAEY